MPAISHLFFTHAARAWGSAAGTGNDGVLVRKRGIWYNEPMILFALFAFLFGACMGSFLNVVILRMPKEESLWRRGSHCASCGTPIAPYDNIPLVSYLVLRGKCRSCGARFSAQYFIVELLTALVFAATFWHRFGGVVPVLMLGQYPAWAVLKPALLPWVADITLMSCLIGLTWIDARHFVIPLEITVTGTLIGFAVTAWYPAFRYEETSWFAIGAAGMAMILGAGLLAVVRWLGSLYYKREALGLGDIHLMVMLAMFLNWPEILLVIVLSSVLGSIGGITMRIIHRQGTWRFEIPYGPYIAAAGALVYFWGHRVIEWYKGLCGL